LNKNELIISSGGGCMLISEAIRKEVFDKNANKVEKVADANTDVSNWTINQFIVKSGVIKKVVIEIDEIEKIGDKVFLKITKDEIEK
jgi:sporulation protein YlmC with PRC-barrel domain